MDDTPNKRLSVGLAAAYLVGYVALDWLSASNELAAVGVSPWNPPPALSIVLVFLYGWRAFPLLLAAAFAADMLVRDFPMPLGPTLMVDLVISLCYATAAMLLRRANIAISLVRQRDVVVLMGVGVGMSLLCGLGVVTIFIQTAAVSPEHFWTALFRWWVGDAVGITVTTPLLLLVLSRGWRSFYWDGVRPGIEPLAQAVAMLASILIVFRFDLTMEFRILYPLFLPMIWVAVRYGFEGAAIAALAMQLGLALASGLGGRDDEMVTQLQFAMLAFTITAAMVGVVVSERRAANLKIRAKEQKLRWLFETAPVGLLEIDPEGRIDAANPTVAEMVGLPVEQMRHRPITDFVAAFPPDSERHEILLHGLVGERWVDVTMTQPENAATRTAIVALRDVSERRDNEQRRQVRQSEIRRVDRLNAAGELASAMAHELNQPLASIVYYTRACQRLLAAPNGVPEARDVLGKAATQALRASDIIRNMRNFLARGEALISTFDVREVIRDACDSLTSDLERCRTRLLRDIPDQPLKVLADRTQTDQIIVNLLRNAVEALGDKPEGDDNIVGISLHSEAGFARIEVWDSGPGIPPLVEADLFKPFRTSKPGGMGLGLAICKSALDAMGGSIQLAATGADGTTFIVLLPLARQEGN